MSGHEDRRPSYLPAILLLIGLLAIILYLYFQHRPGDSSRLPTNPTPIISLDPTTAQGLTTAVGTARDLSEQSMALRGHGAEVGVDVDSEDPAVPEEIFPKTQDFVTSQPLELALQMTRGELIGWVSDEKGLALAGAQVRLEYEQKVEGGVEPPELKNKTDDSGLFLIMEVPRGRWSAVAEMQNYSTTVMTGIDISAGERTGPITLLMPPELKLKGKVTAFDKPLADARVTAVREHLSVKNDGEVGGVRILYDEDVTTEKGTFELGKLPAASMLIRAEAIGYAPKEQLVEVKPDAADVEIVLEPQSLIGGVVRSPRGDPIAKVELLLKLPSDDPKAPVQAKTTSKEDGTFLFEGLPSSAIFHLFAKSDAYMPAGPIEVQSGTMTNIIVLDTGGAIEGTVTLLHSGAPAPLIGVVAQLESESRRLILWTRTNSNGRFRIERLNPGVYNVAIFSDKFTSEPRLGVEVKSDSPVKGVDFVIYPGVAITGTVEDGDTGERLPNATVDLGSKAGPGYLITKKNQEITDASGSFRFDNMPRGLYTVSASCAGYTTGPTGQSEARIEVLQEITPEPVKLLLFRGGIIEGQVTDLVGAPAAGALIQVYLAPSSPGRPRTNGFSRTSEPNGSFLIDGIPLNEELHLYVSAWTEGLGKSKSDMLILSRDQDKRSCLIVLGKGALLTVKVTDTLGMGLSEATVSISHDAFSGDATPPGWRKTTGQQGTTAFLRIPPGRVNISASMPDYLSGGERITIGDDPTAEATIVLKQARSLTGRVVDDRNIPIIAGKVTARAERNSTGGGASNIGADSKFRIDSLGEGSFRLDVNAGKSTATGNRSINWSFPGIIPNQGIGEVILTVPCSGAISGYVLFPETEEPPVNYTVSIVGSYLDDANNSQTFRHSHTFNTGPEFLITDIPPGTYRATITAPNYLPQSLGPIDVESPGESSLGKILLQPGGRLKFRVVNARTNESIPKVSAALLPDGPQGSTNNEGMCVITPITPGIYTLSLKHGDYLPHEESLVKITRGRETDLGVIEMDPGGVVFGKIYDGTKEPLKGILVEARIPSSGEVRRTSTDGGGNYRMSGLVPGGVQMTYSGKVNNRRVATSIDLKVSASEETERDVMLWANSRLRVVLSGPQGIDLSRAIATLYPLRTDSSPMIGDKIQGTRVSSGVFEFDFLVAGSYLVAAQAPDPQGNVFHWAGRTTVNREDTTFVVASGRGIIRGKILTRPPGPAAEAQEVQLELLSASQSGVPELRKWWRWTTRTDSEGLFVFSNLPPGTFSLVAHNDTFNSDILEIITLNSPDDSYSGEFSF